MPYDYLAILGGLFLFSVSAIWYFDLKLFRTRIQAVGFFTFMYVLQLVWDIYALKSGHWVLPPENFSGIFRPKILGVGIPLEDWIFFFVVPLFVVTIYNLFNKKFFTIE